MKGHAHLELTRDAVDVLIAIPKYRMLEGRTNLPEDYIEINCINLETRRLLSRRTELEISSLKQGQEEIKNLQVSLLSEIETRKKKPNQPNNLSNNTT